MDTRGTILIVDDEVRITDILDLYLKKAGYQTMKAANGVRALEAMGTCIPDLVISDLMMPEMDGTELCKQVKTRAEFNNPYFIMLTAKATVDSKVEGLKIGADDYITKPFNVKELVARVNSAMRIKALQNEILEKNVELERYKAAMEKELHLAARFQESLIPQDGDIGQQIRLDSVFQPAIHIGGDIYDVRTAADGTTVFFVADVTGHGIVAALISAMIKLSFIQAITGTSSPEQIVKKINRDILNTTSEEHFASMALGRYDLQTRSVSLVRAGHPGPLHRKGDGRIQTLKPAGFLLGIEADTIFEEMTVPVDVGDRFFLYTDGISEAENSEGVAFGESRIVRYLETPAATPDGLLARIQDWTSGHYDDDITLIQIQINR